MTAAAKRILPERAHPVRLACVFTPWDLSAIARHRMTGCCNYSQCLDYVVRSWWQNFSCRSCPLFVQEQGPVDVDKVVQLFVESPGEED